MERQHPAILPLLCAYKVLAKVLFKETGARAGKRLGLAVVRVGKCTRVPGCKYMQFYREKCIYVSMNGRDYGVALGDKCKVLKMGYS